MAEQEHFSNAVLEETDADHPPILLVDDEAPFADALAFRLEARGIPVRVFYRGDEALSALGWPELEVVLLDLQMPGLHGLDVLSRIKSMRPDVEVILLTGEADFATAAKGMRRGAGDYLLKPVDFPMLLESLEKAKKRALDHKERIRAAEAGRLMALGALAAGVGHEINNPLQVIVQCAEWLQELAEDPASHSQLPAELAKTSAVIHRQATRAGAITAQLLELAHQSRSGKARTRLVRLLDKVTTMFSERTKTMHIAVDVIVDPDLPLLPCSPAEVEPVLHHLLKNAIDAVEALREHAPQAKDYSGGRIIIQAQSFGDTIKITVEDDGEGISPKDAPHIFEPFFSTRPIGKGTGLGLTVCHSIISALKGKVSFSPAKTGGTVFIVEIPAAMQVENTASRPGE